MNKTKTEILDFLLQAEAKALATVSSDGQAHVVPVSTVRIEEGQIVLVNYFMGQTLTNLERNAQVALTFWKGLEGYQIKGKATYEVQGERFELTKSWVKQILPDRVVKGIVVIDPVLMFDISAGPKAGQEVF
jgi:predicted pyridoxine 5'-phosphate oxidase superfamily flavin-nucleotide-binding protein